MDCDLDRVDVGGPFVVGVALTERVGAFAEAAAETTAGDAAVLAQIGATVLASPDVQFGAFLGAGVAGPVPDVLGGVGLSARV